MHNLQDFVLFQQRRLRMSLKALYFHALILTGLVLFSFGSVAKAQDSITADIPDNVTAATGSTISIPVNYVYTGPPNPIPPQPTSQQRIVAFSFVVNFNPAVINTTAVDGNLDPLIIDQTGTLTVMGWSCTGDNNTAGRLGVACATGGNGIAATSGTLINLVFKVVGQPNAGSCCSNLTFSAAAGEAPRFQRFDGMTVASTSTPGTFFVTGTTAASVNLSGRVLTAEGRGLRGAQVRLTLADGTTKIVTTTSFGYYRFADVLAGQTVTVQVLSKKYGYQSHTVNLTGDVSELDFIAER